MSCPQALCPGGVADDTAADRPEDPSRSAAPASQRRATEAVAAALGVTLEGGRSIEIAHTSDPPWPGAGHALPGHGGQAVSCGAPERPGAGLRGLGARLPALRHVQGQAHDRDHEPDWLHRRGRGGGGTWRGACASSWERVAEARFPILAANLVDDQGQPLPGRAPPHHVIEVGGGRVALIGVCCPECERPGQTRVLDPRGAVLASMYTLRSQDVDTFIVLSHLGYQEDRALAQAVPGHTVHPQWPQPRHAPRPRAGGRYPGGMRGPGRQVRGDPELPLWHSR